MWLVGLNGLEKQAEMCENTMLVNYPIQSKIETRMVLWMASLCVPYQSV